LAPESGAEGVKVASTHRRFQRFFQHVRLPQDWAAGVIAGLTGGPLARVLAPDRTNWKIGESHVHILVLAALTPNCKVPLMWTVLDNSGNSGATERMGLLDRTTTTFGKESIQMLLADREFIGADWLNYLLRNDIYCTTRLREGMRVTLVDGRRTTLATLLTSPRRGGKPMATLTGLTAPLHLSAKVPKRGEAVILATNRPDDNAPRTYRERWGIEMAFADSKTRGMNFEDTRLTDPHKLHLLTTVVAIAIAWANRAAKVVLGKTAPVRKSHGYFGKSCFRTGFDFLRTNFKADPEMAQKVWSTLDKQQYRC
jgi:hypothetical protein